MPDNTFADIADILFMYYRIFATYIYNYCSNLLRAVGNSVTPLIFLGVSVVLNIILDLYFVIGLGMGIMGAAVATVISQYVAGLGIIDILHNQISGVQGQKRRFQVEQK